MSDQKTFGDDERVHRLSRLVRGLSFGFAAVLGVAYLLFNLSVVYAPNWLKQPIIADTLISRGIVIGTVLIVLAVVATMVYVRIVNTRIEALREKISAENRP